MTITDERQLDQITKLRAAAADAASRMLAEFGAGTLDATRAWLSRFISWPSDAALDLAVCWIAGTHCTSRTRSWCMTPTAG
jgi:hypothetical protein